jgi:hypothetical protein
MGRSISLGSGMLALELDYLERRRWTDRRVIFFLLHFLYHIHSVSPPPIYLSTNEWRARLVRSWMRLHRHEVKVRSRTGVELDAQINTYQMEIKH